MEIKEQPTRDERTKMGSIERRKQGKLELRERILHAATELLASQDYEQFSLRQVAERIGYTPTTIYLYYKDKAELLHAVLDEGFAKFEQQMHAAEASSDEPVTCLINLGQAYLSFGLAQPTYYRVMFMQRSDYMLHPLPGEIAPRIAVLTGLATSIQNAIAVGAMKPGDSEIYASLLWSMMHGIVSLAITMPQMMPPERAQAVAHEMMAMTVQGLRPLPNKTNAL